MRLHNNPLHLPHQHPYELPLGNNESLFLTLQPLPLGFHNTLHEHNITPPQPPTRIARDSNHKPIRDHNGQALTLRDESDPDYQSQKARYHQRLAVLMLAEALQADPNLHFETPRPATTDWTQYADQLYHELQQAGWSDGHLLQACNAIARISQLIDEDLQQAGRNFSKATPPETS